MPDQVNPTKQKNVSELKYLPWSRGEGFLFGFPATIWMLSAHPVRGGMLAVDSGLFSAWLFAIFCTIFGTMLPLLLHLVGLIDIGYLNFDWLVDISKKAGMSRGRTWMMISVVAIPVSVTIFSLTRSFIVFVIFKCLGNQKVPFSSFFKGSLYACFLNVYILFQLPYVYVYLGIVVVKTYLSLTLLLRYSKNIDAIYFELLITVSIIMVFFGAEVLPHIRQMGVPFAWVLPWVLP